MLVSSVAWLSCLVLALQQRGVPAAPVDSLGPFGLRLSLPAGERLLEYGWDERGRVPFLADAQRIEIPFGERGLSANTRLYLPGNSELEAGASGALVLGWQGITRVDGRLGTAHGFAPDSFVRLALPPQAANANGWTLFFWLRPAAGTFGRALVLLPGAAEVSATSDGRPRLRLLPGGPELVHPRSLTEGEWSFVAVSYDPLVTRQARFVVDGTAAALRFPAAELPRVASELQAGDLARNGRGFAGALEELALEALPLSTGQLERVARRAPAPGEHALELVTDRGQRTAVLAAGMTRALELDTEAEFAQGALDGVAVVGGELRWVPARWKLLEPTGAPPARTAHPVVGLGRQRLLTFGGEARDTHLWASANGINSADTWLFDGARGAWEEVPAATAPAPRCHIPMAYSPDHDLVLLVGGWRNDLVPTVSYGDTWVFHVSARRWEQRFPGGTPPGAGSNHGLVYLPSLRRFLMLRGQRNLLYDPVADTWQLLPTPAAVDKTGQPVAYGPWGSPLCALDTSTGLVAIFGGQWGTTYSDHTVLYDVGANRYTVLDPPLRPSARVRGGFAYDPRAKRFLLFGGVQDQFSARHDDLWMLEPTSGTWSELECSNRPSPRGGYYGMVHDESADRFVLFGGRHSLDRWLDETWTLERASGRPGTALYTFDRLAQTGASRWSADVATPAGASVSFFFRASASGARWSGWRPSPARFVSERFVQVVALLTPGAGGAVPSIRRMGLR